MRFPERKIFLAGVVSFSARELIIVREIIDNQNGYVLFVTYVKSRLSFRLGF